MQNRHEPVAVVFTPGYLQALYAFSNEFVVVIVRRIARLPLVSP